MRRQLIGSFLLLVTVLLVFSACNKQQGENADSGNGQQVAEAPAPVRETTGGNVPSGQPDLTYATFAGGRGKVSALAGKPAVVNMWAVW